MLLINVIELWHVSMKHWIKKKMTKWLLLKFVQYLVNIEMQWNCKLSDLIEMRRILK
jgi:hypothetical protein